MVLIYQHFTHICFFLKKQSKWLGFEKLELYSAILSYRTAYFHSQMIFSLKEWYLFLILANSKFHNSVVEFCYLVITPLVAFLLMGCHYSKFSLHHCTLYLDRCLWEISVGRVAIDLIKLFQRIRCRYFLEVSIGSF